MVLSFCKLQIGCLLILIYAGLIYIRKGNSLNRMTGKMYCKRSFDFLFADAELAVLFDGITACTVNYTDTVPHTVNLLLHAGMFLTYEIFIALVFYYWWTVTAPHPVKSGKAIIAFVPLAVSLLATLYFLPRTEFLRGDHTDYSMGLPVYICFACIIMYSLLTVGIVCVRYKNIRKSKLRSMATALACISVLLALQICFPEYLLSSIAVTLVTIGMYIDMENPDIKEQAHYHHEMITGFATLVESKDNNTGGHIIRSSEYAYMIAKNLLKQGKYRDVITGDFLENLKLAAPMHDIGKIGIPDAILQKPGKLTDEEFDKMKEHSVIGAQIIRDTFSHMGRADYEKMAHDIALHHHEKWNGRGYPDRLRGTDIPLSARIMAVADVFDAVSAKRCYRDAMPLEKCYQIIRSGRDQDFDPDIVDAFFLSPEKIEAIYHLQNEQPHSSLL